MAPAINDGEMITVEPVNPAAVTLRDIVLYQARHALVAHRIIGIQKRRTEDPMSFALRGEGLDASIEHITPNQLLGKVVSVERRGDRLNLASRRAKLKSWMRVEASRLKRAIRCPLSAVSGVNPFWLLVLIGFLLSPAQAQMLSGTYTGNATDNRLITQLGFQPDVVIVKGDQGGAGSAAVIRTSTMAGDASKSLGGAFGLAANRVQSLDTGGFTIGDQTQINADGVSFFWVAWDAVAGEVAVGSYTGNGGANQSITAVGFQPEYVIVMSAGANAAVHRSANASDSFQFAGADAGTTDRITSFDADGFTVGNNAEVNASATTYHWVAWNTVAGRMTEGTYTGNGTDNRDIPTSGNLGFDPEYVIVIPDAATVPVHKSAPTGPTTDTTMSFGNAANIADAIQELDATNDNFNIGTNTAVNTDTTPYFFVAFARATATAVTLSSFTAISESAYVRLQWTTGYEVDNLGFHVYRETGGQHTRITPSLVAGSALLAGPHATLTAGYTYSWIDRPPPGDGPVSYWLEDVDLSGQRTWHGPVEAEAATEAARAAGIVSEQARLLRHLSRSDATSPAIRRSSSVESRMSTAAPTSQRLNRQWDLAADPAAVKIAVAKEGWYRVSQPALVAAGLDPTLDPNTLQVFVDGAEQPIVVTGADDSRFDPDDAIEFYGQGLDTLWTDRRIYWVVSGATSGKRVSMVGGRSTGTPTASSFPFTVERKDRTIYFAALKNGEAENFFGAVIAGEPVPQLLTVTHVDPAYPENARLEVVLQGVTDEAHRVAVQFNGLDVGSVAFDGQTQGTARIAIAQSAVQEGDNLVTLMAQGGETDVSLVDVIRLTYGHTYTADDDALRFTVQGGEPVTIDGFSASGMRVVDVTDPSAAREVRGKVTATASGFAITFTAPASGLRTLLAFTPARLALPEDTSANGPSTWHAVESDADLLTISHGDFLGSLETLKALREAQGLSVALIDVEDLYDEFAFGAKTPEAVRAFVLRALRLQQAPPQAVLLVGDASVDPRNYLGTGGVDFVPTKLVDTVFLETASDGWFADVDDSGIPAVPIGRLPVQTTNEADTIIGKIIAYDEAGTPDVRDALLVADDPDSFDFEAASAAVGALLPQDVRVEELFLGQSDPATARATLLDRLQAGPWFVNYFGHGSVGVWAGEGLLTADDARGLANGGELPVVMAMTCLNGFFHDPNTESLAEALLKAEQGGAVAVWASSSLTFPSGQAAVNQAAVGALSGVTLGEAVRSAQSATSDGDIRRTWLLFGDPTTRLR